MTHKLYYQDAYLTEFTSRVVDVRDDGLRVYLAETAFYPTSGGQQHDVGVLGGVPVIDVVEEDDRIAHVLASPADGAPELRGVIEWSHRYDHMQQHTGQHLLSAVFEDLFGYKTLSVHFGGASSTLDLEAASISRDELVAAETRANAIVAEARAVTVTFEEATAATGLRKASDRSGTLRIVSIDATDRSACGGTHVRSTSEIGPVFVRSTEKVRRATRVEFVCGRRAIERARRDFELIADISLSLAAASDEVAALVRTQVERVKDGENARRKLEKELAVFRARALYDAATPDAEGVRTIVIRNAASVDELRAVSQAAVGLSRVVVIGALTNPPAILLASSEDSGIDCGRVLKERLATFGGRGGGSGRIAQGTVSNAAAVDALVASLINPPS